MEWTEILNWVFGGTSLVGIATTLIFWSKSKRKEDEQRGFWKKMYLAYSLTQDDFTEWTDEQKSAWEEQHKEKDMEE